jgi:hypothetical protein
VWRRGVHLSFIRGFGWALGRALGLVEGVLTSVTGILDWLS